MPADVQDWEIRAELFEVCEAGPFFSEWGDSGGQSLWEK